MLLPAKAGRNQRLMVVQERADTIRECGTDELIRGASSKRIILKPFELLRGCFIKRMFMVVLMFTTLVTRFLIEVH